MDTYGGNKTNVNDTTDPGASLEKGLSSQAKCPKGYEPRTSGEGQRPSPPKGEKAGKFKFG